MHICPDRTATELAVVTFNLQNFFAGPGDPEQGYVSAELKIAKLTLAIHDWLRCPELLLVQEVGDETLLQALGDALNAVAGTAYRALAPVSSDRRGIRVGLLWNADRVTCLTADGLKGEAVARAFGRKSPHPAREPLVGVFQAGAHTLLIINNHFKSNYIPDEFAGDRDQQQARNVAQRKAQAQVVADAASALQRRYPGAFLLVGGDFNAPADAAALAPLMGQAGPQPLVNLLPALGAAGAYTFRHNDELLTIDHLLAAPALAARCRLVTPLALNADAAPELADDPTTPLRCSDHDPLLAVFDWSA